MKRTVKFIVKVILVTPLVPIALFLFCLLFGAIVGFLLAMWAYDGDESTAAGYAAALQIAWLVGFMFLL